RIERVGMTHRADSRQRRQSQRPGKSKGVEERQNAQNFLLTAEQKYLIELLGVGSNVVMSKQNAFGIAGAAAGEDDGGNVVKGRFSLSADGFFNPACRHEREQQRADPLSKTGIGGNLFQQRAFHWWARLDAFKKCFGTDHGFQAALGYAGSNHLIRS